MIAKLCAWDSTRPETIKRMRRAISEYIILGIKTTLPLHYAIMNNQQFVEGNTHTHFLQEEHILNTPRTVHSVMKKPGCRHLPGHLNREKKLLQSPLQSTCISSRKKTDARLESMYQNL